MKITDILAYISTGSKGQFDYMTKLALGVVVFVVVAASGTLILAEYGANAAVVASACATEVIDVGTAGMIDLVGWLSIIIVIAVAVLLLAFFGLRGRKGGGLSA